MTVRLTHSGRSLSLAKLAIVVWTLSRLGVEVDFDGKEELEDDLGRRADDRR